MLFSCGQDKIKLTPSPNNSVNRDSLPVHHFSRVQQQVSLEMKAGETLTLKFQ
jgi:hypothetical protein